MATKEQLARQFQRELDARTEAIKRLRERTRTAEERTYASATTYGSAFIKAGLEKITDEIQSKVHRISQGWPSEKAEAVLAVKDSDPAVIALITAKGVLDVLGARRLDHPTYAAVSAHIGRLVFDQIMLDQFAAEHKDLFAQANLFIHAHKGYLYKVQRFRAAMRKNNVKALHWSPAVRHLVGGWCLDRLATATGWVNVRIAQKTAKKSLRIVTYSKEFLEAKEALLAQSESFAACLWPMLCEPNDWDGKNRGGYLTNELRQLNKLVRSHAPRRCHLIPESSAMRALNRLQKVPYRINPAVLEIANFCHEHRISVGKFRAEEPLPPPPKPDPWESASEEDKLAYRRARTEIEDKNAALAQKNYRTTECLFVANKYKDEEAFWHGWSFDFRGRVYPIATSLSPQGTDFDKALLIFAESGPVNEWWLSFQVATTWGNGLDKAPMNERIEWVANNHNLITRVATDPKGTIPEWSQAEEPWSFISSAIEFYECVIVKSKSHSSHPISVDATCSGLQHLSAIALDKTAAAMVNVVPTTKPSDGYAIVADKAKEILPGHLHQLITRKTCKRTVMTTPYGVTENSARDYIRQELKGVELEKGELQAIVKAIYRYAVREVFAGPCASMDFIQKAAGEAIKQGKQFITWTTPSGFPVVQEYRKNDCEMVNTKLLGQRLRTELLKPYEERQVDLQKSKTAASPNLVHSIDAALIHNTFADWEKPFTVIHDCVLGRSCDMDEMGKKIRDEFVKIYSEPVLENWAKEVGVDFDESIMKNTLDINDVQASSYFFC